MFWISKLVVPLVLCCSIGVEKRYGRSIHGIKLVKYIDHQIYKDKCGNDSLSYCSGE